MKGSQFRGELSGTYVNLLHGWRTASIAGRKQLTRLCCLSLSMAGFAVLGLPTVTWLYRAEVSARSGKERKLATLRSQMAAAQASLEQIRPATELAERYRAFGKSSEAFTGSVFELVAKVPNSIVLTSISAMSSQGKMTIRVVAESDNARSKSAFEAVSAKGGNVLAAYVTNQTFDQTLYEKGVRFELIKVLGVAR